jgi:hypothetical protein
MRKGLLFLFLLLSCTVFAQRGDTVITEVYPDVDSVVEAPAGEPTVDVSDEEKEEKEKNYLEAPSAADRAPVSLRTVPSRRLDSLRRQDEYWYWNLKREPEKNEEPGFLARLLTSDFVRFVFWGIIAFGCLALIYFILLSLNVNLFGKRTETGAEETTADTEADFFSRDYEGDIARALHAGDHRAAIRLRYLQLLKELSDRNIIQYRHERPNGVYVSQLLGTPYYNAFFRVTRTFEYAWYGEMPVTRAAYDFMQNDVDHLKNRFA